MASNNTTNITIKPGRLASCATALRGYINVVMASARLGDEDGMERAIADMRRSVTRLETEARLHVAE